MPGLPPHTLWAIRARAVIESVFSTPGIERLYSGGEEESTSTCSACAPSSSWLYNGKSPISMCLKENSGGASLMMAGQFAVEGILAQTASRR
jgi:hypothetical protein